MGDWADMEIALGWDAGDFPCDDDDDKTKNYYDDMEMESIEINLTPSKYLQSEEAKYLRAKLINNELKNSEIRLEVMHDRYNNADRLALEVYCNKIMIGHMQKYDSFIIGETKIINDFCFIDDKKIDNLILSWKNDKFYLSRTLSYSEEKITQQLKEEEEKSVNIHRLEEKKRKKSQEEKDEKAKENRIQWFKDEIAKEKLKLNDGGVFGFAKRTMAQLTIDTHYSNIKRLEDMGYGYYKRTR